MEAGNTLNRPSPPASAAVLPVFSALRRFLCISGSWTMGILALGYVAQIRLTAHAQTPKRKLPFSSSP